MGQISGLKTSLVASLIVVIGCASSGSAGQMGSEPSNKVKSNEPLTLEDYLHRLNGVQVSGRGNNIRVTIRSNMSITDVNEQPLYVLNGREVGHNYAEVANLIPRGSIQSVEAIPPSRASIYGMQGAAGVIVIKTTM